MELNKDATISHYKIISKIGNGGMGEVYLAQDTKLNRKAAIKLLSGKFSRDSDKLNRFVREAQAASALNHPNIITVYEIGDIDDINYIATEYIEGKTLNAEFKNEPLKIKFLLETAIQIASALDVAHSAGIVHRDIKPENIMIRPDGVAKILDFGIAKLIEKQKFETKSEDKTAIQSRTTPGTIIGTANYMSPEQATGQQVDARTDIFSFGVVLYEMIAGELPFQGETAMESISSILKDEPKPLDNSDVPNEIGKIISKTLRKDKNERYQTIKELLIDLKDLKEELEFQDKLEKTVSSNEDKEKPKIFKKTMVDESNQPTIKVYGNDHLTSKKTRIGIFTIFVISAIGLGYWFYAGSSNSTHIESIAVMPFVNESGNADIDYLSDGMTETLIKSLSRLPNLSVKARSSVFRYKGKETDAKTIGQELNVQTILNGRISQRSDRLILSLELVDTATENVIWSENYNRKQSDLVSLQSEIARDVSGNLKSKLSGADAAKIGKEYTADPEALQLYLKGRYQWNRRTPESLRQAIEFYRQAIEKDPTYALAYSGLAETYVLFSSFGMASAQDSMPQAKAAAQKALELDESVAEAHTALGIYLNYFEYDRDGSERELRRAIELNPNYATAYQWLGSDNLCYRKRFDEALASLKQAEELDPLSSIISMNRGMVLVFARRFDEAIVQLNRTLTIDPNFAYAHATLGGAYHYKGMYAEAITEYKKSNNLGYDPVIKGFTALSLAKSGNREEAKILLSELEQESIEQYVPAYAFALAYIGLNDKDNAFVWLEKQVEERGFWASGYAVYPELDELRDDPRFEAMLKRMNLP